MRLILISLVTIRSRFFTTNLLFLFLDQSEEIKTSETELKTQIVKLEHHLSESELARTAAQNQFEQVQAKLEEFSKIHEENSNLKVEKIQLENEVSKLREALDNDANERQSVDDDKIQLENECSELKEKLDNLIIQLSETKDTSKQQEIELMQTKQGNQMQNQSFFDRELAKRVL